MGKFIIQTKKEKKQCGNESCKNISDIHGRDSKG